MNTGRIDENDLAFFLCDDALDSVTGSLGFVRDSGDLLSDEIVQERRLTGVGTSDERDVAASKVVLSPAFRRLVRLVRQSRLSIAALLVFE
jgi:hypothetical protein